MANIISLALFRIQLMVRRQCWAPCISISHLANSNSNHHQHNQIYIKSRYILGVGSLFGPEVVCAALMWQRANFSPSLELSLVYVDGCRKWGYASFSASKVCFKSQPRRFDIRIMRFKAGHRGYYLVL